MLLALRIKNFKSIRDATVRFGALTCVVGHNGAGKSNLFDAIHFLAQLAEKDVFRASSEIREVSEGAFSPLDLVNDRDEEKEIVLSADMIAPRIVKDDFEQEESPSTTLLTYTVKLRFDSASSRLLVASESLTHAKKGDAKSFSALPASQQFLDSVAIGSRRGGPLISTDENRIVLHGDGGSRGRPAPAGRSPLTVVGGTNTIDYPTVLAAKREMASWRMFHLEPSSMRSPDSPASEPHVSATGGHLAATLRELEKHDPYVRAGIVNRLRELSSAIEDIDVIHDAALDQLVLRAKYPGSSKWMYARSLSDGTLRYIALALMLADGSSGGMLCLEEPENGIHPSRIQNLVALLYDYAVDPYEAVVSGENPLRQVVINTHSPEVAKQVPVADLIFAEEAKVEDGSRVSVYRPVEHTWRTERGTEAGVGRPKSVDAVASFIGGAPIMNELGQLGLEFAYGTAR